ncbi:MAG: hypothetical protein WCE75_17805 [Terracidiphilus sp.]
MRFTRIFAIVLLVLLGVGAVAGAVPMLADPNGTPLGMTKSLLEHSPFPSFLIPGLVLLFANGVLALWVAVLAVRRSRDYGWWIAAQGAILTGWIAIECIFLRAVAWPHYLYGGWGLVLMACGLALRNDRKPQS